jgi:hypothetical protein
MSEHRSITMKIRFFPDRGPQSRAIAELLRSLRVDHELVPVTDRSRSARRHYRSGEVAELEIDGRVFVNPNDCALRKILGI